MSRDATIIEPEPAGPIISVFCGNTTPNDSKTYQTRNLRLNNEPARLVHPLFCGNVVLTEPVGRLHPAFRGNVALNEPVGPFNPAFHGNAALTILETYQTVNLNLNTQTHRIINPEPEHPGRTCCLSGCEAIIAVVCGGG